MHIYGGSRKNRNKKGSEPLRAKICTIIGIVMVLAVFLFSIYVRTPYCNIHGIDRPVWGLAVCGMLLAAGWIVTWGWKGKE